ncbi:hypothetical protein FQN49_005532 [Arthroderma sp. PD_2]|nr:hypothetical protein FQN49_005532 [Arthroderma sp. PD_2]
MPVVPFTVKAVFEYTSEHEDDLNFSIGQIITVTEEEDADWYYGNYTDHAGAKQEGIFPRNFVEKYEPPAPPRPTRPTRSRKESETVPQSPPIAPVAPEIPVTDISQEETRKKSIDSSTAVETAKHSPPTPSEAVKSPVPVAPSSPPLSPPPAQKPVPPPSAASAEPPAKKPPPPAVAEKPSAGSFRDRIAAFNKPSTAPVPFNPNANLSSSFVKKPFVAPPPSKNAYVPPPVEPPQTYRREEPSERVGQETTLPIRSEAADTTEAVEEDQPKPTSLKERIALLQKQQLEQAARHAEAAQKKDKPKKPVKKRSEPQETAEQSESTMGVELQRTETSETAKESSTTSGPPEESSQHKHRASVLPPARELTSDTNDADNSAAGDTEEASETSTSKEDLEEKSPEPRYQPQPEDEIRRDENESEEVSEEQEQEEDDIDPEIKRRMEIRDRMAKLSGGMGMMGMFGGAPGGLPGMPTGGYKKPKTPSADVESAEQQPESQAYAPPIQVMGLPGMQPRKPEETPKSPPAVSEESREAQNLSQTSPAAEEVAEEGSEELVTPHGRPVPAPPVAHTLPPPPPPPESRPVPPPPQRVMTSPSLKPKAEDEVVSSPIGLDKGDNESYFAGHEASRSARQSIDQTIGASPVSSPVLGPGRRQSHPPPPPPSAPPVPSSSQARPPPPPPPTGPISRKSTMDSRMSARTPTQPAGSDSEEEITEYEGDYDTDIASGAKHKDALKAHARDSSVDEGTLADSFSPHSPRSPVETRPPIPQTPSTSAPRSAPPPPPPGQPPKAVRKSVDMPRIPPPPIPAPTMYMQDDDTREHGREEGSDPYRYEGGPNIVSQEDREPQIKETEEEGSYDQAPQHSMPSPQPSRPSRGSADLLRGQTTTRRSMDVSRPSIDQGYIANDVDLASTSLWWTQPNTPPPVFQGRRDVLFEIEEASTNKRGGKVAVSKDVYVLFMDYSQTIVSVQFDSKNPVDVVLEQRHEPPPPRLRQDQLEDAHTQFGARISESIASKQNTTVGDGTPHALIQALLTPFKDALLPVGVRSYGALVYANLANASVQQFDEIRPGDIITFRNCRFQGHRGTMHQKYSSEVGKPDHAGIVSDWDGTKKKVRAWEQGRESKKTKVESYKLGDLKSGECRVWRVMPRTWVGWDGDHKA